MHSCPIRRRCSLRPKRGLERIREQSNPGMIVGLNFLVGFSLRRTLGVIYLPAALPCYLKRPPVPTLHRKRQFKRARRAVMGGLTLRC